jgi:hypothetical protein
MIDLISRRKLQDLIVRQFGGVQPRSQMAVDGCGRRWLHQGGAPASDEQLACQGIGGVIGVFVCRWQRQKGVAGDIR